jgi:hypothetical protein
MMDELIERLVQRIAKLEGWEVRNIKKDDLTKKDLIRLNQWEKIARSCLEEIDSFLNEEEISFEDLEVSARYNFTNVE